VTDNPRPDLVLDLGLILENSSQPFAAGTPDGRLLYFNRAFCELTGYSAEELPSVSWTTDLTPPEWHDLLARMLDELHRTGRPQRYEQQLVHKDGFLVPVEVLMHEAPDEQGQVAYHYAFFTDISERKRAQVLQHSEWLHRLVAENANDWSFWVGLRGQFLYVSPSCERICGYRAEEFEADPGLFRRIIHPDDQAIIDEHERVQHTPDAPPATIEYRIITASGEVRWVEHVCQAVHADDGTFLGRMGAKRDITRRKEIEQERERLEEENRRARAFVEAVLESIAEAVRVHDSEGRIVLLNPAAQRLLPYSPEQLDQPYAQRLLARTFLTEDGKPCPLEELPVARALRGETVRSVIMGTEVPGMGLRWFSYSAAPVRTNDGTTLGAVVTSADITELRQTQERLEEARAQAQEAARQAELRSAELDAIFSTIPTGVIVYGPDGRIVRMNEMATRHVAYPGEGVGLSVWERAKFHTYIREDGTVLPPSEWPAERARRGEVVREEILGRPFPDGEVRWRTTSAAPIRASDGSVTGAVVAFHDITEMRRVQDRLQTVVEELATQNEELIIQRNELSRLHAELDATIEATADGMVILSPQGRLVRMNAAAMEMLGLKEGYLPTSLEELGQLLILTDEAGHRLTLEDWPSVRVLSEHRACMELLCAHTRDGRKRWLTVASSPITSQNGRFMGVVTGFTDVTELREAREHLQHANEELQAQAEELTVQNEELMSQRNQLEQLAQVLEVERSRLRTVIDSAPMAVVVTDEKGRIIMANPRARELYARPIPHLDDPTHCTLELCLPDGTPCEPQDLPLTRSALHGEVCRNVELVVDWPDGQRRDLLVASAPIFSGAGKVIGAVGVFEDVTALKDLERERESLERSKDEFLSVISHELRTPLASIMGYSEILLDEGLRSDPEVQQEFLQAIFDSAGRLNLLLDDLLDLTRLGQRTFRLMVEPVQPSRLLERVLDLMRPMAKEKDQHLELEIQNELPTLIADAQRLGQVLGNLVSNAIKFSPKNSSIKLLCHSTDGEVQIAVTDSGPGIAAEDIPHVFERFYRGRNASRASGTGLGLYVAKEIVEAHGGCLEVESEPGRGSTFRVRLPLGRSDT
jgi:PAS domain S-box-containing protein